jgi:hypothetical protein
LPLPCVGGLKKPVQRTVNSRNKTELKNCQYGFRVEIRQIPVTPWPKGNLLCGSNRSKEDNDIPVDVLLFFALVHHPGRRPAQIYCRCPGYFRTGATSGTDRAAGSWRYWPATTDFGPANRVTLARGALVISLTSVAPFLDASLPGNSLWVYLSLRLAGLVLDGVDGKVARVTGTETGFGARFDMELDALFILGLCFAVLALDRAGTWVLALAPITPDALAFWPLVLSLVLLCYSFGADIRWLYRSYANQGVTHVHNP